MKKNWDFTKGYRIYYNLHTHKFSVQAWNDDKKGWRVYGHFENLMAYDVSFKVYEAGRQRVLADRRKNVHAYVLAKSIMAVNKYHPFLFMNDTCQVTYNPYKYKTFVLKDDDQKEVVSTRKAYLNNRKIYADALQVHCI